MKKPNQAVLSVGMILGLWLPAVAQHYSIVDLGTLPGGIYSEGGGVNILGHVAGCTDTKTYYCSGNASGVGFLWTQQNGLQALPTPPWSRVSFAAAINDSDQVAGISWIDGLYERATLWTNSSTIQNLGTFPGGSNSEAMAINNLGEVAGYSYGEFPAYYHAFLWTSSTGMLDLGPSGSVASVGDGVNNLGHVCGEFVNGNVIHAFLWMKQTGMRDLGVPPRWTWSTAYGINDLDDVVGYSERTGTGGGYITHATLWTESTNTRGIRDLGTLPGGVSSYGFAINNLGQIVGSGLNSRSAIFHAFVWSFEAGMQDLNLLIPAQSGWTLNWATGINNLGQITGYGTINQQTHAFLLTPTP
jgi:probable HAF family extracellular repeat protein